MPFYLAYYQSEDDSSITYHSFQAVTYTMSFFGGCLADSWVGKFNAIMILSLFYLAGMVTLIFSSLDPTSGTKEKQVENKRFIGVLIRGYLFLVNSFFEKN